MKRWLIEQEPALADEIFLDLDPHTGIRPGERWKQALQQANTRCEAVICLLSARWEASHECATEFRYAETLNKAVLCARLEPVPGSITDEWQRCDLFGAGPTTEITIDSGDPVIFATEGLHRLLDGLRALGIGAQFFPWPPPHDPDRAPYRGWAPFDEADAAVFFGRDGQIVRGLDAVRGMRASGVESLLVILGPSGTGKSSFLRAGLLPRLRRDDRRFLLLDIVRPERAVLSGELGLAHALHSLRTGLGLPRPLLGEIKDACLDSDVDRLHGWLAEAREAARTRLLDLPADAPPPTLVLPLDQGEELFGADAGPQAPRFLELLAALLRHDAGITPALIVAVTIRADRYEPLQTAPELAELQSVVFDELKPMPPVEFKEVITGPARRETAAGRPLTVTPELVDRLLTDCAQGADALPLLALTLQRLYYDYGADGDMTVSVYETMGGMPQIVRTEVDELLAADPTTRQAQLEQLHDAFIPWLATINPDNDQPMRRLGRWNDLPTDSHALIDAFVEKRLLVKDERDGEVVVEVALESLLRQWDELAEWLRAEASDLKDADILEQAAVAWERNARRDDWLLEGSRLTDAESLAAKPGFRRRLNPAREFLLASRQREDRHLEAERQRQESDLQAARDRQEAAEALAAAESRAKEEAQGHARVLRRRSRILRAVLALVVVVAVVAGVGFVWAWRARQEADARSRDATALALIANSQLLLAGQYPGFRNDVLAMQMVLAARSFPSVNNGDFALLNALSQQREVLKVINTSSNVHSVAFSPDGSRISSGMGDDTVQLWDAETGQPIGEAMDGHDLEVSSVAFSPDGKRLVSGSYDRTIRLWDTETRQPIGEPMRGHEAQVMRVAFSPDGRQIVSGSADKTLRLWDAQTRQPIGEPMRGYEEPVSAVAFSPDSRRIASGSTDDTLRLWDAETGQPIGEPVPGHGGDVFSVAFSPDGRRVVSGGLDGTVRLWDAENMEPVGEPQRGHANAVESVAFSRDGGRIVSASDDKTVRLWDAATLQPIGQPLEGHEFAVSSVAFSPDGSRVVSGGFDSTLRLWDTSGGRLFRGHDDVVDSVAFSPDGTRIVSGSFDGTMRQWDATTGAPIGQPIDVPIDPPSGVSTGANDRAVSGGFNSDGRQIVSLSSHTVRFWNADTGQPIGEPLRPPSEAITSIAYDDESHVIASIEGTDVQLWDSDTMQPIGPPLHHDATVLALAVSPDGMRVATGAVDQNVRLWDAKTGQPIGSPSNGDGWISALSFSPDGRTLASGSLGTSLRLWNAQTGESVGQPMWQEGYVSTVAFSPDGRTIATGSSDNTVRLWDVETRSQLGPPFTGHTKPVADVGFSPDGSRVVSASADGTLRIWPVPTASPELLCAKMTQNMSREQWEYWVPDVDYVELCPGLPALGDDGK